MWFRTLFDCMKRRRWGAPVGRPPRRAAASRLQLEALEDRCVPASLTVSDVSIIEGNTGVQNALVTVSLSGPSSQTVTVNYSTGGGTASAGSDYQAVSGKLTFTPGQTSKSILVPVIGDLLGEPNETIFVNLHAAKNATIADGRGVVTIIDDEPRLSINDVSLQEGNSGETLFVFTVSLSAASSEWITVNWATADGSALVADNDYLPDSGTLTFAPGETSTTITIRVLGDTTIEGNETFFVNLSGATNAFLARAQGIGTILDDDGVPPDSYYYWDPSWDPSCQFYDCVGIGYYGQGMAV
jgi:hypothetical protein